MTPQAGPDIGVREAAGSPVLPAPPPLALYVHIPWCIKKCPYCDFNSHQLDPAADAAGQQARYVDALLADLQASLPLVWGRPVVSVFMGGGTPSLFEPAQIERLIAGIRAMLPLQPGCEITLEANPGTFERQRFAAFADAGITRLSVGVQSFNDAALQRLGRVHSAGQARAALQEAARVFATFNLDLMYALPGQTLAQLQADVQEALAFNPPHLSIYQLTIEPNTVFAKYPPRLPADDVAWAMLDAITAATGQAGLQRYEVSAYARPGHHCVHNLNYWQFGDYLGIGAGAHGKLSLACGIIRQQRYMLPASYMRHALAGNAVSRQHDVTAVDLPFEYMLNALRLKGGFSLHDFAARTGLPVQAVEAQIYEASRNGWLERRGHRVQPTARGFDFLNDVQALFLP